MSTNVKAALITVAFGLYCGGIIWVSRKYDIDPFGPTAGSVLLVAVFLIAKFYFEGRKKEGG